jgi:hypothetical protein|tara:strand:- start:3516 stop:4196 length:681 start_codon:yes stop_codon:yes gene_type:complete
MQISEATANVLKNFSQINPSIQFKAGQILRTVSPQKTVMAKATIDDTIPSDGAIYDLNRFMGVLSLFEEPNLVFHTSKVTVEKENRKINYTFADPQMIVTPPEKEINFPDPEVSVSASWSEMSQVLKAAAVMQLPEIAIIGSSGEIHLSAIDSKNPTADVYSAEIGNTNDEFTFIFKVENLKLLNLSYLIEISAKGIAKFTSINTEGCKLEYFVATEMNSIFNKGE